MQTLFKFDMGGANFEIWAFSLEQAQAKAKAKIHIENFFGRNTQGKFFKIGYWHLISFELTPRASRWYSSTYAGLPLPPRKSLIFKELRGFELAEFR